MRILCAEIKQESNSFSPVPTGLHDFESYHLYRGAEIENHLAGTRTEIGGFLAVARRERFEIVPLLATMAMSGGPVTHDAFQALSDDLLARVEGQLPADGILLALHGAMLVEGMADPEGELLARLRALSGATPVVVSLDLHANLGAGLLQGADAIVGFDTCPHTDLFETGVRAAEVLLRMVRDGVQPCMALVKVPMILPAEAVDTSTAGPAADLMQEAQEARQQPGILSTSIFYAQPWLDIPNLGSAALAVGEGSGARAAEVAGRLAQRLWDLRGTFRADFCSVDEAIDRALSDEKGPFVFSDAADCTGAGAPGDATAIIQKILKVQKQLPGDALLTVVDAGAARAAAQHVPGEPVSLTVGGALAGQFSRPLRIEGHLRTLFDGRFRVSGPSYTNLVMHMGLTAVVEVGRVKLVITSKRTWTHSPDFYRAVVLEPLQARIVLTKSNSTFKASYGSIARQILHVNGSGPSSPDFGALPYRHRPIPFYPFEDFDWAPEPIIVPGRSNRIGRSRA